MTRRTLIAGSVVLLALAMLTGCVNQPANAVPWLKGQDGIVGASIVSTTSEELLVTGVVRGELKPGLSDQKIAAITATVADYRAHHTNVEFQLGVRGIDFWVPEHRDQLPAELRLWHPMTRISAARAGLVSPGQKDDAVVSLTTLRADAVAVLTAGDRLAADVEVDAFADAAAIADYHPDAELAYVRHSGCHAAGAVHAFAESVAARTDVLGGRLDLCDGGQLTLGADVSEAATAPVLRTDLDARGLSAFPITISTPPGDASANSRVVAVTPGDPAWFSVLPTLEAHAVNYELDADGHLVLKEFSTPTGDLLALIGSAPGAGALSLIELDGETVSASGSLDQLGGLVASAEQLAAASTALGEVSLATTTGSAQLLSAVGQVPDVATAASVLRASGLAAGRTWAIVYTSTQVDIVDGGWAALHDPGYTAPQVAQSFADAWNAG